MPHLLADHRVARGDLTSPADDAALVIAARAGDRSAFDELYRRYVRMVHGVLLGRSTRDDVDDLVQDVFLTAWRRLSTLREPAAIGGWLHAIARHALVDHVRQHRDHVALPDDPPDKSGGYATSASDGYATSACGFPRASGGGWRPSGPDTDRLEADRALAVIRQLPEAYRETLLLRLVEGMNGPEIAARTGLTPDSVRVNLCRGMKLLRSRLDG
ncbi:MAG: sigma-70 family RNA polymerase sigma factor [Acidobacteria bacterium]|nr:sigma-70 family RNA polymerase sigma factor [Acidobacteriota bacterium]